MKEISQSLGNLLSQHRGTILAETANTEAAVLRPRDPGGISAAERAALAVRIALLGDNFQLADCYMDELVTLDPAVEFLDLARGLGVAEPRLQLLADHADQLTARPREASPGHLRMLQAGGVSDADIVRLSELIGFVNYQLRVDAGLRLLSEAR